MSERNDATGERATLLAAAEALDELSAGYSSPGVLADKLRALAARSETRDMVSVPRDALKRWHEAIGPFWFSSDGEEDYNNDGVIETSREIEEFLK